MQANHKVNNFFCSFCAHSQTVIDKNDLNLQMDFKIHKWDASFFELAHLSSAQFPHMYDRSKTAHKSMFPFCDYPEVGQTRPNRQHQSHKYCRSMQTTFNDYGVCYTFNNVRQFLDENLESDHDSSIKVYK